jgi:hypothetical protein
VVFETVKSALTTLLGTEAAGRWTTTGYQGQSVAAESVLNSLRRVTVYYGSGQFPEGRSARVAGPMRHEMTYRVELMVSADAEVDLTALDNPASSAAQRRSALAAAIDAEVKADAAFDVLARYVWNVLMAPANYDLGLGKGHVDGRWISAITKGTPLPRGDLVVLTGTMDYRCAAMEIPSGVTGVTGTSIDTTVSVKSETGGAVDPAGEGAKATQP